MEATIIRALKAHIDDLRRGGEYLTSPMARKLDVEAGDRMLREADDIETIVVLMESGKVKMVVQ